MKLCFKSNHVTEKDQESRFKMCLHKSNFKSIELYFDYIYSLYKIKKDLVYNFFNYLV